MSHNHIGDPYSGGWWEICPPPQPAPMFTFTPAPMSEPLLVEIRDELRAIRQLLEKQAGAGFAAELDRLTAKFRLMNGGTP